MIVGTAGHIDHGKTALIHALTGVDTDRLPEEKKRGISIELGYAYLDAGGDRRIGFVDVPGHERLVHTMLAGATGIDFGLLVVAADDGVMPQTREHLAILSLLGIARGVAVVTKTDRVEAQRVEDVGNQIAALLEGTPLAGAPVVPASVRTGRGLAELKIRLLDAASRAAGRRTDDRWFRLAVDRAFTLNGVGTVATGTVHAGCVSVGEELLLMPGSIRVRVRSLHAQSRAVRSASAGERCGIALAGLAREQVKRGQWLVAPAAALATDRLDASLVLWRAEERTLRTGAPIRAHIGTASALGTVAILDGEFVEPRASARVQLVLRSSICAWHGDRVVLRDASGSRTIAGGIVLDPFGQKRCRRTPQRLAELDALALSDVSARAETLLARREQGLDLDRFAAAQGRPVKLDARGVLARAGSQGNWALAARHVRDIEQAALESLAAWHAKRPDEPGPDAGSLRRSIAPRLPEPLWREILARLQRRDDIVIRGAFVQLPAHGATLSAEDGRIAERVSPMIANARRGAWVRDLAREAGEPESAVRTSLARLAQRGELHQIVEDLYFSRAQMATLAAIAHRSAAAAGGCVTAAEFRDRTQLGRQRAIQVLEYFNRVGLARRVGDTHRMLA
ncbi:MAG: selenocysteine-specific translation elongation factor [Burkholderiales bacterium]|nr:selenocysteine-specific translation elongation factor [Burkholderiales bacterium]